MNYHKKMFFTFTQYIFIEEITTSLLSLLKLMFFLQCPISKHGMQSGILSIMSTDWKFSKESEAGTEKQQDSIHHPHTFYETLQPIQKHGWSNRGGTLWPKFPV